MIKINAEAVRKVTQVYGISLQEAKCRLFHVKIRQALEEASTIDELKAVMIELHEKEFYDEIDLNILE